MSLEIRDDRVLDIVDRDLELALVETNFEFTEGPVWHPYEQHLTFSDIPADRIYRWDEGGGLRLYRAPSSMANGNTYDREGRLITCEHATSRLTREEPDGRTTILASHYHGKQLNSPNDVVVRRDGLILFTDPTYGRMPGGGVVREAELDFRGVYAVDPRGERLELLTDMCEQPNGLALSLDHASLFVADTPRMHIRRFRFADDGGLEGGEIFAEVRGEGGGAPDGLKVDSLGNVYCSGPGGVHIFDPAGVCLGVLRVPEFCANFTWGGDDLCWLFLTACNHLYRCRTRVPGVPLFREDVHQAGQGGGQDHDEGA